MQRICTTVIAVCAAMLVVSAAYAQVTLNLVRIGAKDTTALANFHQAAFGMQEVNRINAQGGPEIFVNFGATVAAIKAAGGTMDGNPIPYGNTGIVIGIAVDPVGNRLKLIQRP